MKRILCVGVVLVMLVTACSAPVPQVLPGTELNENCTCGVYELVFSVERLSGWPFGGWDFVYRCNGEEIRNGYQVLLSVGIFVFYSVRVDAIERNNCRNSFTATFPVAICDGGSGKTEITVTGSNGKSATFQVTSAVTQVGKGSIHKPQTVVMYVGFAVSSSILMRRRRMLTSTIFSSPS